jgi:hypothetical protein
MVTIEIRGGAALAPFAADLPFDFCADFTEIFCFAFADFVDLSAIMILSPFECFDFRLALIWKQFHRIRGVFNGLRTVSEPKNGKFSPICPNCPRIAAIEVDYDFHGLWCRGIKPMHILCPKRRNRQITLEESNMTKSLILAAALAMATSTAFAGGFSQPIAEPMIQEPMMQPEVVEQQASSSKAGIVIPLIMLVVLGVVGKNKGWF